MNRRHQPLDPEERALARLLADAGDDGPPPEVDARILAAARAAQADRAQPATRAGATQPGLRRPQRRRWPLALGLAASVTLAVGVAWQLRLPPQPMPAATQGDTAVAPAAGTAHVVPETAAGHDIAAPAPQPDAAPRPATSPAPPTSPTPATPAATASTEDEASVDRHMAPAAYQAHQAHQAKEQAATASREREHQATAAAARQQSSARREQALHRDHAAAASAENRATAPRPVDSYAESALAQTAPPPPAAALPDIAYAPSDADMAALEDDARLPPTQWLQRIGERQQRGQTDLARASLARLVRTHPDVPVPEPLRPLLP